VNRSTSTIPLPPPTPAATAPAAPPALEPLLDIDGLSRVLATSRRSVERLLSAGSLPPPDLRLGRRMPRWMPETVRRWLAEQTQK
jgi:predicted DNA-binding transcriptional regulator AlpA